MTRRTKLPTPQELGDHARALARAFNVELIEDNMLCARPDDAKAAQFQHRTSKEVVRKVVVTQVIIDDTSYATAMHELGHCIAPLGFMLESVNNKELQYEQERAAWEWAKHYALDWTVAMEQVYKLAFGSYKADIQQYRRDEENRKADGLKRERDVRQWIKKVL